MRISQFPGEQGLLPWIIQKLVGRVAAAAGVALNAHDPRHYAISRWVELMPAGGYSLADIQEWAGHADIRTTQRGTPHKR